MGASHGMKSGVVRFFRERPLAFWSCNLISILLGVSVDLLVESCSCCMESPLTIRIVFIEITVVYSKIYELTLYHGCRQACSMFSGQLYD